MNMLKIQEVAKQLNCSESLVRNLIGSGRLRCYRLGKGQGAIRVSAEQLADFLDTAEDGTDSGEEQAPSLPAPQPPPLKHLSLG